VVHLGVQSTVGVGSAVAGQILIPVPVLGAIIGGAIGGVAVGLYQKIIVPKTKASIYTMLE
jgi:H+/Cl- antiporter ClcA